MTKRFRDWVQISLEPIHWWAKHAFICNQVICSFVEMKSNGGQFGKDDDDDSTVHIYVQGGVMMCWLRLAVEVGGSWEFWLRPRLWQATAYILPMSRLYQPVKWKPMKWNVILPPPPNVFVWDCYPTPVKWEWANSWCGVWTWIW